MAYQPNIPTGTENLDNDYLNLRGNFQTLDNVYQIDHVALTNTSANAGYHKTVHVVNYGGGDPVAVSTAGILYCNDVNDGSSTDTQLYWKTKNNLKLVLTRNLLPLVGSQGYTFLPGGLIIQWGEISATGNVNVTQTYNFAANPPLIAFPNNCFNVQGTIITKSGSNPSGNGTVGFRSVTKNGFTYTARFAGESNYVGLYWFAIGN